MNVNEALRQRKSVRAFLDKDVEREKVEKILDAARQAPSGANTQPWKVAVVSGQSKLQLQTKIENMFRAGDKGESDYQYYPIEWIEPYRSRRVDCGMQLYSTLNITRDDKQRQLDQWAANYRAFDAPVMLLFFMDKHMQTGSFIDYGMFIQSIMLMTEELGLASCPQASLADYSTTIKTELDYPEDDILLCGMSLGYEDRDEVVNSYRTPREDVESFTRYFD